VSDGSTDPDDEHGHHFCRKEEGFIPVILRDLIERRNEIKKKMKREKKGMMHP